MRRINIAAATALAVALLSSGCSSSVPVPAAQSEISISPALASRRGEPSITVVSPADGQVVTSPVVIKVETENFQLGPAGTTHDGKGHLHLLVDEDCYIPGVVIEDRPDIPHADTGMSRLQVDLEPGRHELCVQVSDGFHVAVAIWEKISVDVVASTGAQVASQ